MAERFWEVDLLRGLAIMSMVTFHVLWDIDYLGLVEIGLYSGGMLLFAVAIGTSFLTLVGVSLSLSHSRVVDTLSREEIGRKYILRGVRILGLGMAISFVTWLVLGDRFVIFGVLHCIGLSIILSVPFLGRRWSNLAIGSILIVAGVLLRQVVVDGPWLLWLGLRSEGFASVDYFPLLPWFGVVLLGIVIGNLLYPNYRRRVGFPELGNRRLIRPICAMGRNSLVIYIVHQPITLALLMLPVLAGL